MDKLLWFVFITVGAFAQGTYNTTFPATENPISQNRKWISGHAATNWNDVQTAGYAFGTAPQLSQFSDSTAVLTGNWKPDQWAEATVKVSAAPGNFHEIALRLRTTIGVKAGSCADTKCITGYEIDCSVSKVNRYIEIVRWNGPIGDFTYIGKASGTGCNDGDVLKAVIIGHSISVFRNGTLFTARTDSTWTSGAPGIGFFSSDETIKTYGISKFTASDVFWLPSEGITK
jgi:hypothetical protein